MDLADNSYNDGAKIDQWGNNGKDNQKWSILSVGNGDYKIINKVTGKALVVEDASAADGAKITQWQYNASQNDQWQIVTP